jgi:hypothetical protein
VERASASFSLEHFLARRAGRSTTSCPAARSSSSHEGDLFGDDDLHVARDSMGDEHALTPYPLRRERGAKRCALRSISFPEREAE